MRVGFIAAMSLVITQMATSAGPAHAAKASLCVRETFGTKACRGAGTAAAIGQARYAPHEWGQGAKSHRPMISMAFISLSLGLLLVSRTPGKQPSKQ